MGSLYLFLYRISQAEEKRIIKMEKRPLSLSPFPLFLSLASPLDCSASYLQEASISLEINIIWFLKTLHAPLWVEGNIFATQLT